MVMKWKKAKKMFPSGSILVNEDFTIDELEEYNISVVQATENHYARGMIHRQDELTWENDGTFKRKNVYNVYDTISPPLEDSCLSVYGAKMIKDYITRKIQTFYYVEE